MQSDDQAGSARRPKATIEGSAREVSATGSGATKAEPPSEPHEPPKPEEATDEPTTTIQQWRAVLAPATAGAAIAVAALVVIVALLRFGSETTARAVRVLTGAEAPSSEVAALGEAIGALRARLSTLERLEDRVGDLARRSDAIEKAVVAAAERAADSSSVNSARVDELEGRFAAVDSSALTTATAVADLRREISAAAETGASAAALATRLVRESERLDALESQLRGVEQNLSSLSGAAANASAAAAGTGAALKALAPRLAALERGGGATGSAITTRVEGLEASARRLGARIDALALPAILAAHNALIAKAASGGDITPETAALAAQLGDEPALAPLERFAGKPVPTLAMLADRLADLDADGGGTPPEPAAEATLPQNLVERLLDRASQAIQVRRVSGAAQSLDIARAREMLEDGDITAAAAIVATRPQSDARDAWLDAARARGELDRAMAKLATALDARVASADPAGNG